MIKIIISSIVITTTMLQTWTTCIANAKDLLKMSDNPIKTIIEIKTKPIIKNPLSYKLINGKVLDKVPILSIATRGPAPCKNPLKMNLIKPKEPPVDPEQQIGGLLEQIQTGKFK